MLRVKCCGGCGGLPLPPCGGLPPCAVTVTNSGVRKRGRLFAERLFAKSEEPQSSYLNWTAVLKGGQGTRGCACARALPARSASAPRGAREPGRRAREAKDEQGLWVRSERAPVCEQRRSSGSSEAELPFSELPAQGRGRRSSFKAGDRPRAVGRCASLPRRW